MSYRNKTYVAFASEDIHLYRLMQAWKANDHIDFDFYDAHALNISRDTSLPETIKRNLTERLSNAKQVVIIGTPDAKKKGGDGRSFLAHEVNVIKRLNLPIVVANANQRRDVDQSVIPDPLLGANYYTLSVSFQPKIIQVALDGYCPQFASSGKVGPHYYEKDVYRSCGL